jgi:adenosine deaminase
VTIALDTCRAVPKIALHDHLDGGLRPVTVIEEAAKVGHELPATDPEALGRWFFDAADSGSLVRYLETFVHTVAVMQTADSLRRVAREFVEDQAADGVVHAEARWAPEQHTAGGLSLREAIEAVRDGLADGVAAAAATGREITAGQIVTAMRHVPEPTTEIAELAVAYRADSVLGYDIAGAELGFPPERFAASFEYLRHHHFRFTIHAGEADGPGSIDGAVQLGASRIGHGVRIIEDVAADGTLGELAAYVRDRRIPLELCPSSNLQTGISDTIASHPFGRLADLGFTVTVNCDNRLMSATTMSREYHLLSDAFGYGLDDLERFTLNAAHAAFLPLGAQERLAQRVREGFSSARVHAGYPED